HQSWAQTKHILSLNYQQQCSEREDLRVVNSITFMSDFATRQYKSPSTLSRINESIMIFNKLKKQEQHGANNMALSDLEQYRVETDEDDNSIDNGDLSLSSIADNFKRQKAIADQLSLRMNDLVATKDLKRDRVDFHNKHTGDKIFRDEGHRIIMSNRSPSHDEVAAAMTLAAEKFGRLKIRGSKAYKQQVLDIAVAKDLNIVFHDKSMQAQFVKFKTENQQKQQLDTLSKRHDPIASRDAVTDEPTQQTEARSNAPSRLDEILETRYTFERDQGWRLTINGKTPDSLPPQQLQALIKNDPYLRDHRLEDVQAGVFKMGLSLQKPERQAFLPNGELANGVNAQRDYIADIKGALTWEVLGEKANIHPLTLSGQLNQSTDNEAFKALTNDDVIKLEAVRHSMQQTVKTEPMKAEHVQVDKSDPVVLVEHGAAPYQH
ncbi:LPD7 domain-containing protein, partial [Photobacterium indicum]|uniref:LPD7 domain-containing protein n=1 Tax=Photobacterium indicum TaxID=81447 RepID=UPI003D13CA10